MIEQEVRQVVEDRSDNGERLNLLADEFRSGRDVSELLTLLNSSEAEIVSIGAWIIGELPSELYQSEELLHRLRQLTKHEDAAVRFHALGALFPSLDEREPATRNLLKRLRHDSNEGVRRSADAASERLLMK